MQYLYTKDCKLGNASEESSWPESFSLGSRSTIKEYLTQITKTTLFTEKPRYLDPFGFLRPVVDAEDVQPRGSKYPIVMVFGTRNRQYWGQSVKPGIPFRSPLLRTVAWLQTVVTVIYRISFWVYLDPESMKINVRLRSFSMLWAIILPIWGARYFNYNYICSVITATTILRGCFSMGL